jgi:hypothetical protein
MKTITIILLTLSSGVHADYTININPYQEEQRDPMRGYNAEQERWAREAMIRQQRDQREMYEMMKRQERDNTYRQILDNSGLND